MRARTKYIILWMRKEDMSDTSLQKVQIAADAESGLQVLRRRIDSLDTILMHALAERMQAVRQVGALKRRHDIPPLQPERWQAVLQHKRKLARELELDPDLVVEIYEQIHTAALDIEEATEKGA